MRLFADVTSSVDDPFLRRALGLAERGRGATAPNPLVGCVVVSDGVVVGEGFHPRAGEPHAEIFALAQAGSAARGADVYVTLEPCRHHGLTPPCTDALIAAGVLSVTIGMSDPTTKAGGGAEVLERAGIPTRFTDNPHPFHELNEGWLNRLRTGRPFVTAKLGMSLDAAVALEPDARSDITGPAGSEVTRTLRSLVDGVVVGARTVVIDDPALTIRSNSDAPAERQPTRVVLARGEMPAADSRVFADGVAPTVVIAAGDASTEALERSSQVVVERLGPRATLRDVLETLGRRGLNDVLVEPGPRLLESLLAEDLVDQLVTVVAGGVAGINALPAFCASNASGDRALAHRFAATEAGIVGDVAVVAWRRASQDASSAATEGI